MLSTADYLFRGVGSGGGFTAPSLAGARLGIELRTPGAILRMNEKRIKSRIK